MVRFGQFPSDPGEPPTPAGWAGIRTLTLRDFSLDPAHQRPLLLDRHLLILVTVGHGAQEVDFRSYPCRPGSLLWVQPGQVIDHGGQAGLDAIMVSWAPEAMHGLGVAPVAPPFGPGYWQLAGEDEDAVISEVSQLVVDCQRHRGDTLATDLLRHQLAVLLLRLALLPGTPAPNATVPPGPAPGGPIPARSTLTGAPPTRTALTGAPPTRSTPSGAVPTRSTPATLFRPPPPPTGAFPARSRVTAGPPSAGPPSASLTSASLTSVNSTPRSSASANSASADGKTIDAISIDVASIDAASIDPTSTGATATGATSPGATFAMSPPADFPSSGTTRTGTVPTGIPAGADGAASADTASVGAGARDAAGTFWRLRHEVERSYGQTRRVEDYAGRLRCSVRTLTRACLAATGRSAKQLIDDRVALEARRLLAATDLSVADVGRRLGFPEPTNFGRFFQREVGHSPGAFRAGLVGRSPGGRV